MSNSAPNISHEEIVELQEKLNWTKHDINVVLIAMMSLAELSQRRRPFWRRWTVRQSRADYSEKLATLVLTRAPLIVSKLQEFIQALNEKAEPVHRQKVTVPAWEEFEADPTSAN